MLRGRADGNSVFDKKLSLWFYRRIPFATSYKALERGLKVKYINPWKTSSSCSRCGSKLLDAESGRRTAINAYS